MMAHLSDEEVSRWMAGERGFAVCSCGECAAKLEETQKALALFRHSGIALSEALRGSPRVARTHRLLIPALAAAAIGVVLALLLFRASWRQAPKVEAFVQIPYVIPAAPYERTRVVRMDVPVAALIAAGFRMQTALAGNSIPADVLLGQDGRALAVHLSTSSELSSEKEQSIE